MVVQNEENQKRRNFGKKIARYVYVASYFKIVLGNRDLNPNHLIQKYVVFVITKVSRLGKLIYS